MSVKLRVLLSIALLTILGASFIVGDLADEIKHDPEYTAQSSAVFTEDAGIFFMENWNDMGRLYRMDTSGKVLFVTGSKSVKMDASEDLVYYDGKLYALFSAEREDDDGTFTTYRIAVYDMELELTGVSGEFVIDNTLRVSSLTADSIGLYISAISKNGGSVTVFSAPFRTLKGIEAMDEEEEEKKEDKESPITRKDYDTPDSVLFRERTTERFYVDARYEDPELLVLLDGEKPEGVFAPDPRIKVAVDEISFSLGQRIRFHAGLILKTLLLLVLWIILVILTMRLSKNRDRIVYLYSASEIVFFVILFVAFLFIRQQFQKNEVKNNTRFALMVMQEDLKYYSGVDYDSEDFYESTKYYRLMDSLSEVMNKSDENEVFYDAFIMRKSTGQILADARGYNGIHASYLYGGEMTGIIDDINEEGGSASSSFVLDGSELTAVAYESKNPEDDLILVAICKDRKTSAGYKSSVKTLGILFIVIFVIGSVLLFIALYLQHLDLKHFSVALKDLALGKPGTESSESVARDMRELWQCYGELSKRIEQINYEKYKIFEAYYRFAPKGIETIMGRESIFDVENGDVSVVGGNIVLLAIDKEEAFEKKVRSLSNILSNMEYYANQDEAILISRDQSLSNVRVLLMMDEANTLAKIIQFIQAGSVLEIKGWSVLMYRDVLTYGVAGSKSQSLTYINSDYSRVMDAYAEWFRLLGVPLVLTGRVLAGGDAGEVRYIGCSAFEKDGERIQFYESLDAYPAATRQLMLINRNKFEETLQLYYSKDFYLARNQFMEILKDCPEDGITRWYLFECERYMNGDGDITQSGYIDIQY